MSDRPGDPVLPQPARLWTVEQANGRLPHLEELLPRLRSWAARLVVVSAEVERLVAFWGPEIGSSDHVDHDRKVQLDLERQHLSDRVGEAVGALGREGIEVKDLEHGLVDFYGLVDGEVVYLCWRPPEPEVAFYHPLDGGFRARRPLPARPRAGVPRARTSD